MLMVHCALGILRSAVGWIRMGFHTSLSRIPNVGERLLNVITIWLLQWILLSEPPWEGH